MSAMSVNSTQSSGSPRIFEIENSSYCNYNEIRSTHLSLSLNVDFEREALQGHVTHTLQIVAIPDKNIKFVVDCGLNVKITKCSVIFSSSTKGQEEEEEEDTPFVETLPSTDYKWKGKSLSIPLDQYKGKLPQKVRIYYETQNATALQFLAKEATVGKKHPYLFTQAQAIHCRTMLPCQDAPGCKVTYDAKITVPAELKAVMSAALLSDKTIVDTTGKTATFFFLQETALSSYLIALAVGNLTSRKVGPRSHVWSEPEVIDKCAHEFAECESYIKTGESFCGPYDWGHQDVLVLPPSFPYGGMENPCLTFVTPTLLAGDRSLASVVIHEISHSWMGNLVTCETWADFWMNEGFCVFLERKIVEKVEGADIAQLRHIMGYHALEDAVKSFNESKQPEFTALHIPTDHDPDDSFSSIPYNKGCALLYHLQTLVGGPAVFEPYLQAYVKMFKGTVNYKRFIKHVTEYFQDKCPNIKNVQWEKWIHGYGCLPDHIRIEYDRKALEKVNKTCAHWIALAKSSSKKSATENHNAALAFTSRDEFRKEWGHDQRCIFLETLIKETETEKEKGNEGVMVPVISAMGSLYGIDNESESVAKVVNNREIQWRWITLCLKNGYSSNGLDKQAVNLVATQGRMKFTVTTYKAMKKSGKEDLTQLAKSTYEKFQTSYHPICRKMVEKVLFSTTA